MQLCNGSNQEQIINYIGKDYGKCLYIFIDMLEYGLDSDFYKVWMQKDENDEICAIVSKYYSGMQVYSKNSTYDVEDVANLIKENNCELIFGAKETVSQLEPYFPDLKIELGTVGGLKDIKIEPAEKAYSAPVEELAEVVELIASDEAIGKPYGYDSLYKQYVERKETNFGRNWVIRSEETGNILCHAGTYAETKELAVIGGVMTAPEARGKGVSKPVLAAICNELKKENKDVFSFYYIPVAKAMHEGVGFETVCIWQKLYK